MGHTLNCDQAVLDLAELQKLAYVALDYTDLALEDAHRRARNALAAFHNPNTDKPRYQLTELRVAGKHAAAAAAGMQVAIDNLYFVEQALVRPSVTVKDKLTLAELAEQQRLQEDDDGE